MLARALLVTTAMLARALLVTACATASPKAPARSGDFGDDGMAIDQQSYVQPGMPSRSEVCPDESSRDGCFLRVIQVHRCSGVDLSEQEERKIRPVYKCICDLCRADTDCAQRAGGRCTRLPGDTCDHDRSLCLYPGDVCYDRSSCRQNCLHAGDRAVCTVPADPPP